MLTRLVAILNTQTALLPKPEQTMIEEMQTTEVFIKRALMRYGLNEGHSFRELRRKLRLSDEESALLCEELDIA